MATSEKQIGQCGHHINLASILGQATQSGLFKAELLFDHPEWVLDLGADVCLCSLDQILQHSLWRVGQRSALATGLPES